MDPTILGQHAFNGLILGVIYAMVAVGFTLFFGVLDVIKFSHGDVLTVGAFGGLVAYLGLTRIGVAWPTLLVVGALLAAMLLTAGLGAAIARFLVLPLKSAPPINVLLITLMAGTALREAVRLFYPAGSNPKPFPRLLPTDALSLGALDLRYDSLIIIASGLLSIVAVQAIITRTRLGLAIRAVAQDGDTARIMGIPFQRTILVTFAMGSAMAALAGVCVGLYYNEINFAMGLLLGVIGFSAAVVGGLGNLYGAVIGGFLFAGLQTLGAVWFEVPAYKDVFAFAVVILLMAWRPTGILAEQPAERV
jgi:branched-chain amino acid transport system permease protein